MRKILLFAVCPLFFMPQIHAASSTADLSSGPIKKERVDIKAEGVGTGNRRVKSDANLYYIAKNQRDPNIYKNFSGCNDDGCEKTTRSVRAEVKKVEDGRKYNMNNPFYQPLKMQFASVTDLSYIGNGLDFEILPPAGPNNWLNHTGKYSANNISVTENLSFGVTDSVSIIGQARFTSSKLKLNWPQATPPGDIDKAADNKVDLWGIGAQWRVINDKDWIVSVLGAYQNMTDAASVMTGEAKIGYKNDDTTIYGFGRVMSLKWDNDSGYGFGLKNQSGQTIYFAVVGQASSSIYYDAGVGIFAALDKDWSIDAQLTYSDVEWHNQIAGRLAVAYQPWKNISIGAYGRIALWDSADGFDDATVWFMQNNGAVSQEGKAAFDNYSDWTAGLQVTAAF